MEMESTGRRAPLREVRCASVMTRHQIRPSFSRGPEALRRPARAKRWRRSQTRAARRRASAPRLNEEGLSRATRFVVLPSTGVYHWIMLDWTQCAAVERNADKVRGAWVFVGTRVPVKTLFENLESGACIDEFLEWFPGVTRQQAEAVLAHAERSLIEA